MQTIKIYPAGVLESLYNTVRAVSTFLVQSVAGLRCMLDSTRAVPCHGSFLGFSWTGSGGVVGEKRSCGLGTSELDLCFLQMMWFC